MDTFENKNSRTELGELGEFGLIDLLAKNVVLYNPETNKGIGDDAAVIDNGNLKTVITTDMLIEGVHFDLVFTPLKHLGYKAVIVNLSDIYAMNATPKQIVVSIALSSKFSLEAVEELYAGILLACEEYKVDLVGGDTTSSRTGLVINITAIGVAPESDIVYRNTANESDLICVTGDLGAAYLGLQLLNREKQVFLADPNMQPDFSGYDYLLERQLKPEAQKWLIEEFKKSGITPTSMIDVSDGLASELFHICTQSKKGCRIYEEKIPIDIKSGELADEFNLNILTCALNGGEDYELLFTVPISDFDKVKDVKNVSIIGHITDEASGLFLIGKNDEQIHLRAQGWDAFRSH